MNSLTEDHLIYHIASYLKIHELSAFGNTSKRIHSLVNGNDRLWQGGEEQRRWPWYALKVTSIDLWNKYPALEVFSGSSCPHRDLYVNLATAEREFLHAYFGLFATTPSISGAAQGDGITSQTLYEWSISIDEMIASANQAVLKLYQQMLKYLNCLLRHTRSLPLECTDYSKRLNRIIDKSNLRDNYNHFLSRKRLSTSCLTRHLSIITYTRSRAKWSREAETEKSCYSIDPFTVLRGRIIETHSLMFFECIHLCLYMCVRF